MKRLRKIFRRLKSFRPRCLCAEDDVTRCQSAEEVYQRSDYSDVRLKPEPKVPAEPSEAFIQFILPGQCEVITSQEELNLPVNPEIKFQVEELLGPPETTSICELSESEEEVHVPIEPEVEPEIKALPDPSEAASSSNITDHEQDLHELQCEVEAFLDSLKASCFSDLSESEEDQNVFAEPEVETEIEALPDPTEAASSSDFAELEQDLHELQCMAEAIFDFPEAPCFSDLSNTEEEPEVETEIEALPDPTEAASSSDFFAELEQDLHELQCMVEGIFDCPEAPCEEQRVLAESEIETEIEDFPDQSKAASSSDFAELEQDLQELQCMFDACFEFPEAPCEEQQVLAEPEAASSTDFAEIEQDLQELQCMFDACFDVPEEPCFSDLSNSEEEQHILIEPDVKTEIKVFPDPPEATSSSDFSELQQDLHKLQREVKAILGSPEVPCFSDLSESEEVLHVQRESEADKEPETLSIISEATSGLQDFRCCAVLGEGAFGKVLLAENKLTQSMFAIKAITKAGVIRRRYTARLRCEKEIFQTVSSERYPFLVNLVTSFQDEHYIFFVMEYAAGGDLLSNNTRVTGSFPQDRAVFYGACVVLGLEFLHQNKIIHRDLKLENVVLDKEGFAKLTDFGLSKAGIGFGDRTKSIVGTPLYMAPEMVTRQPYTRDVDWWSLGILIYDMLAKKTPFDAHNDRVKLNHNIVNSDVLYPRDWSPESISLVSQLLVKNPSQRLGSSKKDAEDVKTHPFFRDIDWRKLFLRELRPPFLPPLSGPEDVSNFDAEFSSMAPVLTSPEGPGRTQEQQDLFKDFDWTAEWAP